MHKTRNRSASLRLLAAGILCGSATLSQAQVVPDMLYATPTAAARDNYTGAIGCEFEVGSSNVIVSHLGFFNINTNTGLNVSHNVGLFTSSLVAPTILGEVTVPAGPSPDDTYLYVASGLTNGFLWVPLDPPLLLSSNTQYIVAGLVFSGDGDTWMDLFTPDWNTDFVGATGTTTRHAIYGPGVNTWPPTGFSQNGNDSTYGNVCLANIQVGQALVGVQTTNVDLSAGQTVTVNGFASGQIPITYQWYLSSGAPVPGQTNATLLIPNAATTNSGTYYLTASNSLGGEQSSNVVVSVTAIPVSILQQPTNTTVFQNYTATFSITAAGTPPIYYQWFSNGVAIPGATASAYSTVPSSANNGDVYFCLASNVVSSVPETSKSSNATLTVIANVAQPQEFLHGATADTSTNNYTGMVGGVFETGDSPVQVTYLGYYATQFDSTGTNATLNVGHNVAIFSGDGASVIGSVDFAPGLYPVINGYVWTNLDPPVVLASNTPYILAAETFSGEDPWGNFYIVPDFNPYFTALAPTASSTFANIPGSLYGGGLFPTAPVNGDSAGAFYSAPNMAILALPAPAAYVLPESGVTTNAGFDTTLTAIVEGQAPLTVQWYEEPGVLLANQTNLTLTLNNLAASNSGSYYVIATNKITGASAQSEDLVVTVNPDIAPYIVQDITPSSPAIVVGSSVTFSAIFGGSPTFTYGWQFNGNAVSNTARLSGASGNELTINDVQPSDAGVYQLFATNAEGNGQSSQTTLTVVPLLPFNNGIGFSSQGNTINWPETNVLQLTEDVGGESNSAFSSGPLYIGAFEASFTYQVVSPFGTIADGATFCIQNDPRGAAALGYGGGALGVSGADETPGPGGVAISPSVEFEFNIYSGNSVGGVGVSFDTNGAIGPVIATTNVTPPLLITNGDTINTLVTYLNGVLTVTLTDTNITPAAVFTASTNLNITSVLGTNVAYVGFTGADGGDKSMQQISDFSFLSLPQLSAQASGTNLVLSWPDAIGAYMLRQSPVLGPSAHWTPVSATPALVQGNTVQVSVPLSGTSSFYELIVTNAPSF
jgi:hypothetical protein